MPCGGRTPAAGDRDEMLNGAPCSACTGRWWSCPPAVAAVLLCLALGTVVGSIGAVAQDLTAQSASSEALLADKALLQRLTMGGMSKFRFGEAPVPLPEAHFRDAAGVLRPLSGGAGKLMLVAFWASWCAPCRTELPSLERLQVRLEAAGLDVVAVSIDKSRDTAARALESWGVRRLRHHHDEGGHAAARLGVPGVPMTLLIDAQGREIGRLRGSAVWDSVEGILLAEAVLNRLTKIKASPSGAIKN